jgi:hypothetical protein
VVKQEPVQHGSGSGGVIDLRGMTQAQLLDAATRHNSSLNIRDPASEILEGIRDQARVRDPSCIAYPCTLGRGSE